MKAPKTDNSFAFMNVCIEHEHASNNFNKQQNGERQFRLHLLVIFFSSSYKLLLEPFCNRQYE